MILGYIFTVLNYISYCLSRFMKKKKDMLALNLLAKIFTVLGFFCLHSLTGAYNMTVAIILLIIANIKERKKKKMDVIIFCICLCLYWYINIYFLRNFINISFYNKQYFFNMYLVFTTTTNAFGGWLCFIYIFVLSN